jgi:hypothetical protein
MPFRSPLFVEYAAAATSSGGAPRRRGAEPVTRDAATQLSDEIRVVGLIGEEALDVERKRRAATFGAPREHAVNE